MEVAATVESENWWKVKGPPRVRPVKKVDFWEGLDGMSSGAGLMVDWEWRFGATVDLVRPFLRATAELARSYPCISHPVCDCRHELVEHGGKLLSVCSRPGECFCERECVELEQKDLVVHAVDRARFGEAVRGALGLGECRGTPYSSLWLAEVGALGVPGSAGRAPVYFSTAESGLLAGELGKLKALRDGPLILLTARPGGCGCDVKLWLEREGGGHVALSSVLVAEAGGKFGTVRGTREIMRECTERLAHFGVKNAECRVAPDLARAPRVNPAQGPRYLLRRVHLGWRLVFDGNETVLWDEKAVQCVAVLLLDPPVEPIHGTELANKAFGDAVVEEQRNLGMDDAERAQEMAAARRRCQAVIEDDGASEVERQEARAELEEIEDWARKHLRGTEGNEQRQVRAIRQNIRRLLDRLQTARNEHGEPDKVLRAFGEHLDRYLWRASGGGVSGRTSRVRAGLAGRFTYEPPQGVRWSG